MRSASGKPRRAGGEQIVLLAAGLAVTLALAIAAVRSERQHRAAVERVLRDYAGVAGTEFVRRTAFDVGFNGYQVVAAALRRGAAAGAVALPEAGMPRQAKNLVDRLFVVERGQPRLVSGSPPPAWLEAWVRAESAAPPRDREGFWVRHRTQDGHAATLVLVPLDARDVRVAAFEVDLAALRPFLERSIARGPLLPEVIGDGRVTNASVAVSFRDHAGAERLRAGPAPWPEWEVEVSFADFFYGVLEHSHVRVSLDPALAERLLPGGLPPSRIPMLAALAVAGLGFSVLAIRQVRRERAFALLRDDFVASVSHELRTPLAQIRLFVETVVLGRCRSEDEERRFLEAVHRETLRLGHLVDNILDFSRAERGLLDASLAPRRLAPVIGDVARAFEPLAATRGVRIEALLDPDAGAAVDEAGFRRVLLNLLDNAVKYGPAQADVTVRLRRMGDAVELAVEDRGPGVPPQHREAIFAPFRRLGRDRQSPATGAGIGLAVVRELVSCHGGSCRVEDREGGGASFVVRLPAAEAPPA
jgi:signal transduction histidine kinase